MTAYTTDCLQLAFDLCVHSDACVVQSNSVLQRLMRISVATKLRWLRSRSVHATPVCVLCCRYAISHDAALWSLSSTMRMLVLQVLKFSTQAIRQTELGQSTKLHSVTLSLTNMTIVKTPELRPSALAHAIRPVCHQECVRALQDGRMWWCLQAVRASGAQV